MTHPSFLEYVARDILSKYGENLARVAIVFPNKRASLFMNECLATQVEKPIWSPSYLTISELFQKNTTLTTADPIKLVCDLHKIFTATTGINETLDHFYGWGQLLIADFDDIDKNMADASKVFANLRDIHEYDDLSYLTDEQKQLLKKFFNNFSDDQDTELKQRFLKLWSHIYDIYSAYNSRLQEQGLGYEGSIYRQVVSQLSTDEGAEQFLQAMGRQFDLFIFVGFNMVNKVEQTLFSFLKHHGKARFYWDFDRYYMGNEAGYYIGKYLEHFPNELDISDDAIYNNFSTHKDITYLASPTEDAQARYVANWLRQNGRIDAGRRTAIVLCDESLLPSVIHNLPTEVKKANVTTGYPLSQSPFMSLIDQLADYLLAVNPRRKRRMHERLKQHPYMRYLPEELPECADTTPDGLAQWLLQTLQLIGVNTKSTVDDPFFQESLFKFYTIVNRLHELMASGDLTTDTTTLRRLLLQIVNSTSIPFHGEPIEGIQIMGVLETRNLDFDHLLLLSCNEGNIPHGINDSSFIPYSVRRAYELTTIDHKVAIYAYYFHRLLQRASDITLTYNNATQEGQTGEMSRFMQQLLVESSQKIGRQSLTTGQTTTPGRPTSMEKTPLVADRLKQMRKMSPTAINTYLRCQMQFFYKYVMNLRESDEPVGDDIDRIAFGDIFHESARAIYDTLKQRNPRITADDLDYYLKNRGEIERIVDNVLCQKLACKIDDLNGLQIINRRVIIDYLQQLLKIDREYAPFTILGNELPVEMKVSPSNITLFGKIDRLDEKDGNIRVVDYKTGSHLANAIPSLDDVFSVDNIDKYHSDYFLQTMLYAIIVKSKGWRKNATDATPEQQERSLSTTVNSSATISPALLYIQHASEMAKTPILKIDKELITDIELYRQPFMEKLNEVLANIQDPQLSFTPTADRSRCTTCPYQQLCHSSK